MDTLIVTNVMSERKTLPRACRRARRQRATAVADFISTFRKMSTNADQLQGGAAAAFLASSDSSFMTASEVAVDGGLAQL